jgi:hypothetical protein
VDLSHEPQSVAVGHRHDDERGVQAALPKPRACLCQGASLRERDAEPFVAQRLSHRVGENPPEAGVFFYEQDPLSHHRS